MNLKFSAKYIFLAGTVLAQLGGGNAQTPAATNTNNFELGVGLRRQVVAPGDTIKFIEDDNYQDMTAVSVTFRGTSNPCGGGSQTISTGSCTVPVGITITTPYSVYSFCRTPGTPGPPGTSGTGCPDNSSSKGDISVQPARSNTHSTVYIALTLDGQVNNALFENDTLNWLDINGMPQGTKLTGASEVGWWTPCSGQSGGHQKNPCQGHVSWPLKKISFSYDCEPNSCSDPVVHLIKPGGSTGIQDLIEWSLRSALHITLISLTILTAAFGIGYSLRKA